MANLTSSQKNPDSSPAFTRALASLGAPTQPGAQQSLQHNFQEEHVIFAILAVPSPPPPPAFSGGSGGVGDLFWDNKVTALQTSL